MEFSMGKAVDEIQKPIPMPEDWYKFRIVEEPTREPNKKMKENPDQEGAGYNIVVKLKSVSNDELYDGRPFTRWLSLPNKSDEGRFTGRGQPMVDFKAEQISKFVAGFGGGIDGETAELTKGMEAYLYVIQKMDGESGDVFNEIDDRSGIRQITV